MQSILMNIFLLIIIILHIIIKLTSTIIINWNPFTFSRIEMLHIYIRIA